METMKPAVGVSAYATLGSPRLNYFELIMRFACPHVNSIWVLRQPRWMGVGREPHIKEATARLSWRWPPSPGDGCEVAGRHWVAVRGAFGGHRRALASVDSRYLVFLLEGLLPLGPPSLEESCS